MSETSTEPTLRARGPGYSVMQQCLRIQAEASAPGGFAAFRGADPLLPAARSWYAGALGELQVARMLATLHSGWTVLHAVPIGSRDADIDHIVIGRAGVFTINTKSHAGKRVWVGGHLLSVNGYGTNHIRKSIVEADRVARRLKDAVGGPVEVTPVLVIVGAQLRFGRTRPAVTVLTADGIVRWLESQPEVHSKEAVEYVSLIAEERATWHSIPVLLNDTLRHVHRFERLMREVEDARGRRRRWAFLLSLGLGAAALLAFGALSSILTAFSRVL